MSTVTVGRDVSIASCRLVQYYSSRLLSPNGTKIECRNGFSESFRRRNALAPCDCLLTLICDQLHPAQDRLFRSLRHHGVLHRNTRWARRSRFTGRENRCKWETLGERTLEESRHGVSTSLLLPLLLAFKQNLTLPWPASNY